MIDLLYVFVPAAILLVWFESNAFVEYCKLLQVGLKFFGIDEYKSWQDKGLSYPEFLVVKDNTFFNRLISCPICLNFWLNVAFIPVYKNLYIFCAGYCLSLLVYFLVKLVMIKGSEE
tara:strand:- start:14343 stop:14693 length:351 start_codon:yes stop_codon:yes gene_type:complete